MTDQYAATGEPPDRGQDQLQNPPAVPVATPNAQPGDAQAPAGVEQDHPSSPAGEQGPSPAHGAPAAGSDARPAPSAPPSAPDPDRHPWLTPSGWQSPQAPQTAQGGAQPADPAPSAWTSGYPTPPAPGHAQPGMGHPADAAGWQAAAPQYPGQAGYGYPGAGQPGGTGAPSWQYDTTVFPAAGAPPAAPPDRSTSTGTGGSKSRTGLLLLTGILVALLAGGIGGYVGSQAASSDTPTSTVSLPQVTGGNSERPDGTVAAIAKAVSPAVVSIAVTGAQGSGSGSGFVIRPNGYIVTNNHVVEGAADSGTLEVHFVDGREFDAEIVGRDPSYDIAVIKVEATDLPTVVIGDSDSVVVGDLAIAFGSPLELDGTVTAGIISALNRPVTAGGDGETAFINAIQTDAAINPGNSGGALVNAAGQVIGVNSAIATLGDGSGQSGSIGLGFAIPINQVKRIAEELINTGSSTKPIIGVTLDQSYQGPGARVQEVTPGGPAEAAGVKAGDTLVEFAGEPVTDATALIVDIRSRKPGDEVEMTVQRGSDTEELTITLGSDSSSN